MALSATAPRPSLFLASLAMIEPIVETRPEKLADMADALLGWAEIAAKAGKPAMADRYFRRAGILADLANTHPCCGVSKRDFCQC